MRRCARLNLLLSLPVQTLPCQLQLTATTATACPPPPAYQSTSVTMNVISQRVMKSVGCSPPYIAAHTWPALTAQEQLDSKAKADAKVKVAKAAKAKRKREEEAAADPEAASRKARREYLAQVSAHVCACHCRCVSEREVNLTAPPGITTDGARCEKSDCRAHVWQLYVVIDHTCRKGRSCNNRIHNSPHVFLTARIHNPRQCTDNQGECRLLVRGTD